jgi:hypothetical protein
MLNNGLGSTVAVLLEGDIFIVRQWVGKESQIRGQQGDNFLFDPALYRLADREIQNKRGVHHSMLF